MSDPRPNLDTICSQYQVPEDEMIMSMGIQIGAALPEAAPDEIALLVQKAVADGKPGAGVPPGVEATWHP